MTVHKFPKIKTTHACLWTQLFQYLKISFYSIRGSMKDSAKIKNRVCPVLIILNSAQKFSEK